MSERRASSQAIEVERTTADRLAELRAEIDAVDEAILENLNRRASIVKEVGRLKEGTGLPVFVAGRERDIVARLTARNRGPFPNEGLPPVFREIISVTRALEEPLRVAYFGPEGTFTHLAARQQFGAHTELLPAPSIPEVIAAVEKGRASIGVVPVENTTEGIVTATVDTIVESELTICGELLLRVSHDLMSRSGRREDVRRIASHPQPLAQCRLWLDSQFPETPRVETASTAAAARLAAEDGAVAAIGSPIAANVYGLRAIESEIEDRRDNTTRFWLVSRTPPAASGRDLTTVVFTIRKDRAGALHRLLEPFARHGVNLSAIQSRPIKGKPWEYLFFLDVEGHVSQTAVADALAEAGAEAQSHKLLGSYPRATGRLPDVTGSA
jgi:chorismate mutase/prephenate dehydratase